MRAIRSGTRSVAAYPGLPAPLCTARTTGRPAASEADSTASTIASTWWANVTADRSASTDSRPGRVSAVTSRPSARSRAATSSQAQAPSQKPGTRTIGAAGAEVVAGSEVVVMTPP